MEIVPMSVGGTGASHPVGLPCNRRNVEEWSRLDSITGMMEKAKIQTDRWSAGNNLGKHNFAKVVDSRERNMPDGSLHQKQRKQMEMFQTKLPGGSMQVIRTQTVTSSSSSSWTAGKAFGELQLPVNSLDLSSEKSKGSVGRSGSISTRRPPSRPRSLTAHTSHTFADLSAECNRLHEQAKARMFGGFSNGFTPEQDEEPGGVVITEIDSPSENSSIKSNLNRQKSCSNEVVNDESSIQRSSKFRRSLQIPKTTDADDIPDWTNGKSLKERAAEIENLLRSGSSSSFEKVKVEEHNEPVQSPLKIKNSFVSAQTLQEVRDRLRKSSNSDNEGRDDGIVPDSVCVRDILSGFEEKIGINGTIVNGNGSISSRSNKSSISSSDWIRRRKSYGFEKVDSEMYGQSNEESSTDSGLGNSSESKFNSPFRRFINEPMSEAEAAFTRKSPLPSRERSSLRCNRNPWLSQLRGTKLGDRDWSNGTPDPDKSDSQDSPVSASEEKTFDFENSQKKTKKVEFCKTEVHFAAEPGRFHIVETDGKPPSAAVQRRSRRRVAGRTPSPPHNPLGLPEVKFGDSLAEKELLGSTSVEKIDNLSKRIESELKELSKIVDETLPKKETACNLVPNLPKLYDVHEEEPSDLHKPRSILKTWRNSFHAGDHADTSPVWKSTVVLKNKLFNDLKGNEQVKSYCSDGESELKIRFRNLRKADEKNDNRVEPVTVEVKRRSFPDEVLLSGSNRTLTTIGVDITEGKPVLSVAERIKQAELQAKNYSTKIDFRLGEVTVLQNGTRDEKIADAPCWPQTSKTDNPPISRQDLKTVSNPSVKRLPIKDINTTTTTRISINIPCETKTQLTSNKNKPTRSLSFGAGSQRCEKPQSTSLVLKTIKDTELLKRAKPVHEMINKFDSLSRHVKPREQRRRTMPINYKAPKAYTHADLEEELKNFTDNLDKDFKDIYEEEIGSLKGSCRDLKNMFDKVCEASLSGNSKYRTLPLANGIRRKIGNDFHGASNLTSKKSQPQVKISTDAKMNGFRSRTTECVIKHGSSAEKKTKCRTKGNPEDSGDDSDLLADEEVRSYMSAGHGGSENDEPQYPSKYRKKSFERIRLQFKRLELGDHARRKDWSNNSSSAPIKPTFVEIGQQGAVTEPYYAAPPKVASISLRYEDDPTFKPSPSNTKDQTDRWENTSNCSSNLSDGKSRERVSYLNGPSLSEKFSKTNSEKFSKTNSSLDNLFEGSALQRVKEIQENLRSSFRSSRSSRFREVIKEDPVRDDGIQLTLEELTQAADDMVVAANGLTDDSMASTSDDDRRNSTTFKRGKVGSLVTISEGRKTNVTSSETKKVVREKSLSSRATRLLHRANNREAAIAQRSSSEDIPALEPVKKKLMRRPRQAPTKVEKDEAVKICSRAKVRSIDEPKKETISTHRERSKTLSSAAKEVIKTTTSRPCQLSSERTERTKTSERRELLANADAIAEQLVKNKRTVSSHSSSHIRADSNRDSSTKRRAKVNLRRVEATRVSQAV